MKCHYCGHSAPVLTVEKLEGLAEFANGNAMVTQGRSFFQQEYDSGAAVCLISESLARENGLPFAAVWENALSRSKEGG